MKNNNNMKQKKNLFAAAIFIAAAFLSCTNSKGAKEPEQLGSQVFELMKNFDKISKEEFSNNFISFEEAKKFGEKQMELYLEKLIEQGDTAAVEKFYKEKEEFEESLRQNPDKGKEEHIGGINANYQQIKREATDYGINWQDIEYVEFFYDRKEDGFEYYKGGVIFNLNGKSFVMRIHFVRIDDEYKIGYLDLDPLRKN